MSAAWAVGQRVIINRATIAVIDRVMPSGRVIVGARIFNPDGRERSSSDLYRRARMELLTPAIEAEVALVARGRKAAMDAINALSGADVWTRETFSAYRNGVPDSADVDKAERLAATIKQVLGDAQ